MSLITSAAIREVCARVLSTLPSTHSEFVKEGFTINLIDELADVLDRRQTSIELQVSQEREDRLSICYLGALAIASFAVLFSEPKLPRVIPAAWIRSSGIPDPDLVVHALLSSICAHSLAVLKLVRSGLEPPARIVLRNVHELTWIAVVVSAEGDAMRVFAQDLPDDEERRLFRTHFSVASLNGRLKRIESSLGLPDDVSSSLRASRRSTYAFYSKTVHNSYPSIALGLVGFSMEREGYAALGMATEASESTLRSLATALFYFLGIFFEVIHRLHSFAPPYAPEWQEAFAARQAFLTSYASYEFSHRND